MSLSRRLFLLLSVGNCLAQIRPPVASSGVITAFSIGTGPGQNNAQFSPDGANVAGGFTVYSGASPVTAILRFGRGVLTAFSNVSGNQNLYRVHFSADGSNLGGGSIRYEGRSPVTAMAPFGDGVLTAFSNASDNPNLYRVHFSPDGNNLGSGNIRYEGRSPVTAMIPFGGGVLTAFSRVLDDRGLPVLSQVRFSPDGDDLAAGPIVYEGTATVTAMVPFAAGILTVFTHVLDDQGSPILNRVQFSADGDSLTSGPIVYEGTAPVTAIAPFLFPPSDTFAGSSLDSTKWEISGPLGASTVTQDGGLLLTNNGTEGTFPETPGLFGPGAGVGSKCKLNSDFDLEVRFRGFSASGRDFAMAMLNVYQDANNQLHIKRIVGTTANGIQTVYLTNGVVTSLGVYPFAGTSGRFRIIRKDGVLTTLFDPGSGFLQQLAGTSLFSGDVVISLMLLGPRGESSSVTFQNFRVNWAGGASCQ